MALKTTSAVARQSASPAQTGNLSPLQIAQVAYAAGFRGDKLTTAVAIALAESGGNPKNVSPTNDYGLWQINQPSHPQYFKQSGQIFDPSYNAAAAFNISAGGANWSPWTTYKTGAYKHYLGQGIPTGPGADKIISSGSKSGGGFLPSLPTISNPLKWADEMAKAVISFVRIMVDPVKLGEHLANAGLWLIRQLAKGIYKVIILPPWHWTERATVYYYETYFVEDGGKTQIGVKAFVTMGFWAVGYAILWGRFEPTEIGVPASDSALAQTIGSARNAVVARRITKPKDVESKTAKKPEPKKATVPLEITRTVAANRRRTVKVTDNQGEDVTNGSSRGRGNDDDNGPQVEREETVSTPEA